MPANLVTVELLHLRAEKAREDTHLDYRDDDVLREKLAEMVQRRAGGGRVDLSQWTMKVRHPRGTVLAEVSVTPAGRTRVRR